MNLFDLAKKNAQLKKQTVYKCPKLLFKHPKSQNKIL